MQLTVLSIVLTIENDYTVLSTYTYFSYYGYSLSRTTTKKYFCKYSICKKQRNSFEKHNEIIQNRIAGLFFVYYYLIIYVFPIRFSLKRLQVHLKKNPSTFHFITNLRIRNLSSEMEESAWTDIHISVQALI